MVSGTGGRLRVVVFVDYSNFRPSMQRAEPGFQIDLRPLGSVLAAAAGRVVDPGAEVAYSGLRLYGSYDDSSDAGAVQKRWYDEVASQVAGVSCFVVPRQRKRRGPVCPSCRAENKLCGACGGDLRGTEEKGVDVRIATDLISMAWDGLYDAALLVSSDRDFVPVVGFLQNRTVKVVHGGFGRVAAELSGVCWGRVDIPSLRDGFRMAARR